MMPFTQQIEGKVAIAEVEKKFVSTLETLAQIRAFVRWVCREFLRPPTCDETLSLLEVAVTEVVSNVVIHAYGEDTGREILVEIKIYTDWICIYVYHTGTAFEPEEISVPVFDGSQERGFGLYLISKCVEQVGYFRDAQKGNAICLLKRRQIN